MPELLEVKNLSVSLASANGTVQAVRDVSFTLCAGEVLALVGESGCGKSILCKSILRLLPKSAVIQTGHILADGIDITCCPEQKMTKLRGSLFSMLFQDPMTALDPCFTVGTQICEAVQAHHQDISPQEARQHALKLLELVDIDRAEERYRLYPSHFSGGMRQRAVLAIALAGEPKLLFADEPTTALDVTVQAQILNLLRKLQQKMGMGVLLVSHDLGVVAHTADRVAIMYAGKIVEIGTTEEIFSDPRHPYTQGLLRSLPSYSKGTGCLYTIPGMPPSLIDPPQGDAFAFRNRHALAIDYEEEPPMFPISETHFAATWLLDPRAPKFTSQEPDSSLAPSRSSSSGGEIILDIRHLHHRFYLSKRSVLQALDDVSFQVKRGEIFGLIGESGSGKSTIARCVMGILRPSEGEIFYNDINICDSSQVYHNRIRLQRERQLIFQDSSSSLNQRMRIADIIAEPLRIHKIIPPRGSLRAEAAFQLNSVGLDESYLNRYPAELSGGQRQRVAIARALAMEPQLLVADEPIASLDASVQAQIISLFQQLRDKHAFSILFIAHDLAMVEFLCDRVGVLYHGRLVELGPVSTLFSRPKHPYTQALLAAIPIPDPAKKPVSQIDFSPSVFDSAGKLLEIEPEHFVLEKEGILR